MNNDLLFSSRMLNGLKGVRSVGLTLLVAVGTFAAIGCSETTAPERNYAVLDDAGQSLWSAVSVGADHTCGLRADGTVYCWGSNRDFQLGVAQGDTTCGSTAAPYDCAVAPQAVAPEIKFASISAGAKHTCAIAASREAYCWGANDAGQLGAGVGSQPAPVRVPGTLGWAQISAGYAHTCAVRTDGALYCWGSNSKGELGIGSQNVVTGIVRVAIGVPVASVSAGQQRTCARTTLGAVFCWGLVWTSRSGGMEMSRVQAMPQQVPGAPAMTGVSVGSFTTCGADATGTAFCWEANPRGQMGTGTRTGSTTPLAVAADLKFVQVSAGIVQTCGVATSGAAFCWGDDTFGQLGVSPSLLVERCDTQNLPCSTVPTAVFGAQRFTQISAGFGSHVCGVTVKGNLYCWGLGVSGQRGDGTASSALSIPAMALEPGARS